MLKDEFVRHWNKYIYKQGDDYIIYSSPVRCPANLPPKPDGWEVKNCGGAHPYIIVYDPNRIACEWCSANENWVDRVSQLQEEGHKIIEALPASVHGCWKLRKHQTVIVYYK